MVKRRIGDPWMPADAFGRRCRAALNSISWCREDRSDVTLSFGTAGNSTIARRFRLAKTEY